MLPIGLRFVALPVGSCDYARKHCTRVVETKNTTFALPLWDELDCRTSSKEGS